MVVTFVIGATAIVTVLLTSKEDTLYEAQVTDCISHIGVENVTSSDREFCEKAIVLKMRAEQLLKKRHKLLSNFCRDGDATYYDEGVPSIEVKAGIAYDHNFDIRMNCESGIIF